VTRRRWNVRHDGVDYRFSIRELVSGEVVGFANDPRQARRDAARHAIMCEGLVILLDWRRYRFEIFEP
jgi:hypothetical protein